MLFSKEEDADGNTNAVMERETELEMWDGRVSPCSLASHFKLWRRRSGVLLT